MYAVRHDIDVEEGEQQPRYVLKQITGVCVCVSRCLPSTASFLQFYGVAAYVTAQ